MATRSGWSVFSAVKIPSAMASGTSPDATTRGVGCVAADLVSAGRFRNRTAVGDKPRRHALPSAVDRCPAAGIRSAPRSRRIRGPFLALSLAFTGLFTLTAAGQSVQAEAPWLTVYDETGRPKWEVRMETLVRTTDGWEGKAVEVQLYHEGAPRLVLRAPRIRADRYGREWTLFTDEPSTDEPIVGEGEGFSFTCQEARWTGGLLLVHLTAEGRGVALSSVEARWDVGDTVHLAGAEVEFGGWQLTFETGRYELQHDRLVAGEVRAAGHGVTLTGTALVAWPEQGKLHIEEAHLVRTP